MTMRWNLTGKADAALYTHEPKLTDPASQLRAWLSEAADRPNMTKPPPRPLSHARRSGEDIHVPVDQPPVHSQGLGDKTEGDLPLDHQRGSEGTRGASAQVQPPVKGWGWHLTPDLTNNRPSCKEFLSFSSIR